MSDQSLFAVPNPAGTPPANPAATQNDNPYAHLLGTILNESGSPKYQNVEEALKGAAHAQAYIAQLKAEKAEAEARAAATQSAADKQAELERTVLELSQRLNTAPANQPAAFDPTQIADLVSKTLDQRTVAERSKANQKQVVDELVKTFGTDAETKYNAAAQELGLTVGEMNEFAAKSPKAVLKALGIDGQPAPKSNPFAPASTAVRTEGFQPTQDTFIRRNTERLGIGATTQELNQESARARKLVEEMHAQGASVHDLSDPKVYARYFK